MRVIGQNDSIRSTLKKLFDNQFDSIKHLDYNTFVHETIKNNPTVYNLNAQDFISSNDESEIQALKDSLKNFQFASIFNSCIKMNIDEDLIKSNLKQDLKVSLNDLKRESLEKYPDIKRQALFLTFCDYPNAWVALYGEGEYPVLKKPEYLKFYSPNELILFDYKIDYSLAWKNLTALETAINEIDLYNQICYTDTYNALRESYIFKTYLLLFDVFNRHQDELFEGFPIKKPFYIYGNEHDCEPINIFIIE
jgi:hypothetical protein